MIGWEALGWILPSEPGRPYVMDRDHIYRIHVPLKDSDRPAIHAIPLAGGVGVKGLLVRRPAILPEPAPGVREDTAIDIWRRSGH